MAAGLPSHCEGPRPVFKVWGGRQDGRQWVEQGGVEERGESKEKLRGKIGAASRKSSESREWL